LTFFNARCKIRLSTLFDIYGSTREMNTSAELVTFIQRQRERDIAQGRLARVAACARACCSTSLIDRLARALRLAPTTC